MTQSEALLVFQHIPLGDTYVSSKTDVEESDKTLKEVEDEFDFKLIIDKLMSLNISVTDAIKFVEGEVDFATMDNKRLDDDYDYLMIDAEGNISCWTELGGHVYRLNEMNITFKDYEPSPEELEAKRKFEKQLKERLSRSLNKAFNSTENYKKIINDYKVLDDYKNKTGLDFATFSKFDASLPKYTKKED